MTAFYALLALQILDLVSTVIALRNPSLKEANGPLAGLMKSIGTLPALMCIKTLAMVLIWHHRADMGNWLIALCVLYAVVIVNNIRLIKKG
jgi:hypothetical protein